MRTKCRSLYAREDVAWGGEGLTRGGHAMDLVKQINESRSAEPFR